jgi:hypothetical protein
MAERPWDVAGQIWVIAPSPKTTRTILVVLAIGTLIGGLFTFEIVTTGTSRPIAVRGLATWATMFVVCGTFFIGLWLWSANVRLLIGQGRVGYRNIFRKTRLWSRGEIDHVVEMSVSYWRTQSSQRGIYLFGLDGKRLLVLSSRAWRADDLKDFIEASGVPLDVRQAPVTIKDASREFPNAFGWGSQHVLLATSITMVAAVAVAIGGYALASSLFAR